MLLAHGVGGRQDLPIPFGYALTGALLALVVSFAALAWLWRTPRLGLDLDRPVASWGQRVLGSTAWRWGWRLAGLLAAALLVAGFLRPDTVDNPVPGTVYVLFWVGLLFVSLLFGPVWRGLNPLRALPLPGRWTLSPTVGLWPAAIGLLAFVWLELVAPHRVGLPVIGTWLAAYVLVMLAGAAVYGPVWFDHADPFETYSALAGRLAPIARRDDGTYVWRHPFDGLATLPARPGLVAFVMVLLGSTMYDSVSNAPFWVRVLQSGTAPAALIGTAGLLAVIGLVAACYLGATALAARLGGRSAVRTAAELAHSIVPIAVGYLVAHYFTLFVLEGQRTVALWFGADSWTVRALGTTPQGTALLQVTVIVLGHVFGTVFAHDRALRLFDRRAAVLGQIPLLALMVVYTVAGLLLLFAA